MMSTSECICYLSDNFRSIIHWIFDNLLCWQDNASYWIVYIFPSANLQSLKVFKAMACWYSAVTELFIHKTVWLNLCIFLRPSNILRVVNCCQVYPVMTILHIIIIRLWFRLLERYELPRTACTNQHVDPYIYADRLWCWPKWYAMFLYSLLYNSFCPDQFSLWENFLLYDSYAW